MNYIKVFMLYICIFQIAFAGRYSSKILQMPHYQFQNEVYSKVIKHFNNFESLYDLLNSTNDKFLKSYKSKVSKKNPFKISKSKDILILKDLSSGESLKVKITDTNIMIDGNILPINVFSNTQEALNKLETILIKERFSFSPKIIQSAHAAIGFMLILGAVTLGTIIYDYGRRSYCKNKRNKILEDSKSALSQCRSDRAILSAFSKRKSELKTYEYIQRLKENSTSINISNQSSCIEEVKSEFSFILGMKSCLQDTPNSNFSAKSICKTIKDLSSCLYQFEDIKQKQTSVFNSEIKNSTGQFKSNRLDNQKESDTNQLSPIKAINTARD